VVVIYALGSIIDCLYRVSRLRCDAADQTRAIVRLIPADATRNPIQAVATDGPLRLRDATTGTTITASATLSFAPDRPLAVAYTNADSRAADTRPPLRDPADPTTGAYVTTVGSHDVIVDDPPAGREADPTHATFVLRCAACEYTAHPRVRDTNELAAFAEQAFADLSCPPTLEQYDPESADPASQSATNSTTSGTDPSAGTSGTTQEPPAAADSPDRDENVDVDATKFM